MNDEPVDLPPVPAEPVDSAGAIRYGRYLGSVERVDWGRLPRNRLWRFLHWKRWQYASFVGPEVVGAVAIAHVGFATTAFAYLFDRPTRRVLADISLTAGPGSGQVADHVRVGARTIFRRGAAALSIEHSQGGWHVAVRGPELHLDAHLAEGPSAATICAIAPVPGGVANCTHKTHGLEGSGSARIGGTDVSLEGTRGALDHTSGLLARDTAWRWASGASRDVAINLVAGFQEPLENALWQGGRISPLPPVAFTRESDDPMASWRVRSRDGAVDLRFEAEGIRSQDKNLVVAVSRWIQPIGTWTGTVAGVDVGALTGVLEDHVARW
jgi:hypothetical protein